MANIGCEVIHDKIQQNYNYVLFVFTGGIDRNGLAIPEGNDISPFKPAGPDLVELGQCIGVRPEKPYGIGISAG